MSEIKLYTKDSKGKIREVVFGVFGDEESGYIIQRTSGLVGGKITQQPSIIIMKGKAKRTIREQMELELASMIKEKRDKGYKDTIEEISDVKTDDSGRPKPMLAKDPKGQLAKIIKGKKGYVSQKLDGIRCMLGQKNGEYYTCSRGGGNYDTVCKNIFLEPAIKEFFKYYPDILLDGELYCHGHSLEELSGDCRKINWVESRHAKLEFWIFDVLIQDMSFEDRLKILQQIKPQTNKVKIVEHIEVNSEQELMDLHDAWVSDGYEGAIWRDANEVYKVGGRDNRMIKVKLFQDAEFKVIGITEGLRDEDMVFVCEMEDGKQFEAKPVGTRETRLDYLVNFEEKYKERMATIKFFHYSEKGVPNLPIFKNFRIDI